LSRNWTDDALAHAGSPLGFSMRTLSSLHWTSSGATPFSTCFIGDGCLWVCSWWSSEFTSTCSEVAVPPLDVSSSFSFSVSMLVVSTVGIDTMPDCVDCGTTSSASLNQFIFCGMFSADCIFHPSVI